MIIKPGYAGIVFELPDDTKIADIGFGHDPTRGATYYIDRELGESVHREGRLLAEVPKDKFIQADVSTGIPLPTQSCDFVVASNIAEHMEDPVFFCSELSRIAKEGYIETPGMVQELLHNKDIHPWYVTKIFGTLVFIRKPGILFRNPYRVPLIFPVRIIFYLFRQTCFHWEGHIRMMVVK